MTIAPGCIIRALVKPQIGGEPASGIGWVMRITSAVPGEL